VLDVLADAEDLPRQAELLLDGFEGRDGGGRAVGAEEIPGIKAREVLQGAEKLVATDGGGDEFLVVRDGGVVD